MLTVAGPAPVLAAGDSIDPPVPTREQVLHLPGDPDRPVTLEATLFEPPGDGPFALAVVNHGAIGDPRSLPRYRASFTINYLLSRGYAVLVPMMRGFAGSGGTVATAGCDLAQTGELNARDILAAIRAMAARSEIDTSRVAVLGQSFGGWNSLALATIAPTEVKAVVNFVGGMRSGDCADADSAMLAAMARFGQNSRVASLWFYGERDALFPPELWREEYKRFSAAGGTASLVDIPGPGDAHTLTGSANRLGQWVPRLDAYFAEQGLPHRNVYPQFLPSPRPARTNYAMIDDVKAVPWIGQTHPEFYARFLADTERPRVLVVSPQTATKQSGGFDPMARALGECRATGGPCSVYAYDDDVVWTGPTPGAAIEVKGVPVVGSAAQIGGMSVLRQITALAGDCRSGRLPVATIEANPAHGRANWQVIDTFPQYPAGHPLAVCNGQRSPVLRLVYAPQPDFVGVDYLAVAVRDAGKPPRREVLAVHVP